MTTESMKFKGPGRTGRAPLVPTPPTGPGNGPGTGPGCGSGLRA